MSLQAGVSRGASAFTGPRLGWMRKGLCAGSTTPDLWFPEPDQPESAAQAKRLCAACPVRRECLAYAVAADIRHGVWGGMAREERTEQKSQPSQRRMDPATRSRKTETERKRRHRLRSATAPESEAS